MAHLFTYQDFAEGVIGLAYVAHPDRNSRGGICSEGMVLREFRRGGVSGVTLHEMIGWRTSARGVAISRISTMSVPW